MEHVIYQSIMQHLEHNNILYSKQHSLRKNHSCETQLLLTIEDLAKNLDEGSEIYLQISISGGLWQGTPPEITLNIESLWNSGKDTRLD